jgi:hypothetical protein
MKTMSSEQRGGARQVPHRGSTADEVIKALDRHLKELVAHGDAERGAALKEKPIKGMGWYRQAKRDCAALRES